MPSVRSRAARGVGSSCRHHKATARAAQSADCCAPQFTVTLPLCSHTADLFDKNGRGTVATKEMIVVRA